MVGVKNYDDARTALKNGAGGIFIGSWTDPALLTSQDRNIAALRAEIGRPFAVSIDAEGGRVQRQPALFGSVPSPREMAATMKPEQVTGVARDLGTKLRERGITMDFAPVLDVDGGSANGAIGDRSFSGDPAVAATYATAFAQGLREAGIEPVYKHFPGHGRASGDTHKQTSRTPALAPERGGPSPLWQGSIPGPRPGHAGALGGAGMGRSARDPESGGLQSAKKRRLS